MTLETRVAKLETRATTVEPPLRVVRRLVLGVDEDPDEFRRQWAKDHPDRPCPPLIQLPRGAVI